MVGSNECPFSQEVPLVIRSNTSPANSGLSFDRWLNTAIHDSIQGQIQGEADAINDLLLFNKSF